MNTLINIFWYRSLPLLLFAGMALSALCCSSTDSKNDTIQENVIDSVKETNSDQDRVDGNDYSGTYKLKGDPICMLMLVIKKDRREYIYTISGDSFNSTGKLSFTKTDDGIYLVFGNTKCSGSNSSPEGVFKNNTIMIQNYGNSMSNYTCFRECDSKFLQFVKIE